MKKLTTLLMGALLFGAQSMTAQDTSSWKTGDDVTDQLQWQGMDGKTAGVWKGNKSFEGQSGRYFVNGPDYCGEGGNQNSDGAGFYGNDFEMWNASAGAEAYQIFYLPAGVYTFKIQATSRESRNASDFFDETAPYNSEFYAVSQKLVSEATTDADGNAVEAVYENNGTEVTAKIMNIFAAQQTSQVYTWPADASSWQSDGTNVYEGTTYYMPSSMWGTGAWFDQDLYWPEEDSEFNTIKVLQMEDGYMRIGVRKRANINDDWVIWRGCKAVYEGDAGDAAKLMIAEQAFNTALSKTDKMTDQLNDYIALQYYFTDAVSKIQEAVEDEETAEAYDKGVEDINALMAEYESYVKDAKSLGMLVGLAETTAANTDYAGKAAFTAAIAAAKEVLNAEFEVGSAPTIGGPDAYGKAVEAIAKARADYAMSQGAVNGAYDFMSLIAYPFFCQPEFEPKWNENTQRFESIDLVINGGEWNGETWAGCNEDAQTWQPLENNGVQSLRIGKGLDKFTTDKESVYAWYQVNTTGYEAYYDHKLPSCKQWAPANGSERGVAQNLVGLPNGFYSLKGMANTWTNDWGNPNTDPKFGVRLTTSDGSIESQQQCVGHNWWDGWTRETWQTFTTDLIEVKDGKATVAFFANGFSTFTGMQLYYYGVTPDFTAMIAAPLAAAQTQAEEKLVLAGDKAAVAAILASVPSPVAGADAYKAAVATIDEANAYTNTAANVTNSNDLTSLYFNLQLKQDPESPAFAAIEPAIAKMDEVYGAETTTYKDIQTYRADYNAYEHYFGTVSAYEAKVGQDAAFQQVKAEQATYLGTNYADAQKMVEFEIALAAPYNAAVMATLGDLSKATADNPVDITALVINPTFAEGNKGWTGAMTVDGELQTAERFNCNFDINQTIYSLPKGVYEVRVKALYRDGNVSDSFKNVWYPTQTEDENGTDFHANVDLYANDNVEKVVSICNPNATFTERSFTEYTFLAEDPMDESEEQADRMKPLKAYMTETDSVSTETGEHIYTLVSYRQYYTSDGVIEAKDNGDAWIYDVRITDGDDQYFFPASMRGATARFQNDNGAYTNTVRTAIAEESGNITFGLRKSELIGNDWCFFDDFRLLYLGADQSQIEAVGITGTQSAAAAVQNVYTLGGVRTNGLQKGMNIVRMSDGTVKKVFVK